MKKIILLLLILTFSCKENKQKKENIIKEEPKEIKYVTAKSGLIFRDKPKGKRLGKFEFNEKLIITEHTNVFQEIKNDNKILKDEWVGTKFNDKTVYVFGGFLSTKKTKITLELVKYFMGNKVWLSQDFMETFEKTKSISSSLNYKQLRYTEIAYYAKENRLYVNSVMEPNPCIINSSLIVGGLFWEDEAKITQINNKTLTFKCKNDYYIYIKTNIDKPTDEYYRFDNYATDNFIHKIMKGKYIFKTEKGSKNITDKEFLYHSYSANEIRIDGHIYQIDNIKNNTFYLEEIKFADNDEMEEEPIPTGKKATLTKI